MKRGGSPRGFGERGNIGKISKGTSANFWEQGNKIRKITVRKHSERVWEHGNIGQFWKGTWTPLHGRPSERIRPGDQAQRLNPPYRPCSKFTFIVRPVWGIHDQSLNLMKDEGPKVRGTGHATEFKPLRRSALFLLDTDFSDKMAS